MYYFYAFVPFFKVEQSSRCVGQLTTQFLSPDGITASILLTFAVDFEEPLWKEALVDLLTHNFIKLLTQIIETFKADSPPV